MRVFQDDKVPKLRKFLCVKNPTCEPRIHLRLCNAFILRTRRKTRQVSLIGTFALCRIIRAYTILYVFLVKSFSRLQTIS